MTKHTNIELHSRKSCRQGGFTIIELMIATLIFSVIMLVAAGTVVRFTNNFQKSLAQSSTQNAARSTVDLISQQLQFIGNGNGFRPLGPPPPGGSISRGYCIQGTKFSYVLGRQLQDQVPNVLMQQDGTGDGCGGFAQDLSSGSVAGKELLAPHMRLAKFEIVNDADDGGIDGSNNPLLYRIQVKVVFGADDLLCVDGVTNGSPQDCSSTQAMTNVAGLSAGDLARLRCKSQIGSQFCAASDISTTVQRRL